MPPSTYEDRESEAVVEEDSEAESDRSKELTHISSRAFRLTDLLPVKRTQNRVQ
jgi:hypothetical protein